jgi:hypothetical protein
MPKLKKTVIWHHETGKVIILEQRPVKYSEDGARTLAERIGAAFKKK